MAREPKSHRVQAPLQQQDHLSRTSSSDHPQELPVFHTPQSGRQKHVLTRTQPPIRHESHLPPLAAEQIPCHSRHTTHSTADATRAYPVDSLVRSSDSSQAHRARQPRVAIEPCARTLLCGIYRLSLLWKGCRTPVISI